MKLTIELVPQTAWYSNVRSNVTAAEWDVLRKECYKKAGYKCEVCAGKGPKHPVECHEIWDYNDETHKQTLLGLIALCPDCHSTKHVGLAQIQGRFDVVLNKLMTVNEMTKKGAEKYVNECFDVWEKRSQNNWELDITFLEKKEDE
jgi:5-methylcytosine-specific restriction endonuclease McrA